MMSFNRLMGKITAVVALLLATPCIYAYDSLLVRKNLVFFNLESTNPLFETRKESVSCAKDFYYGNHNVPIQPGKTTERAYDENWHEGDCPDATKIVTWVVTATRAADQLNVQCKISFITESVDEEWATQVKVEAYPPKPDVLCTSTKLFNSATCRMRPNGQPMDCLNKFVPGHAKKVEIMLGGPALGATKTELINPFESHRK